MRTRGAIAHWRQFEACLDSVKKHRSGPGCKHGGDTYNKYIRGPCTVMCLGRQGVWYCVSRLVSTWRSLTMANSRGEQKRQ